MESTLDDNLSFTMTTMEAAGGENATSHPIFKLTIYSQSHLIYTSVLTGTFILLTIIGNVFVIAAVVLERSLHNVANYLILSLAVADLMVAVLVMPITVITEISKNWFLRAEVCDMWVSFDLLCCTASILHLVAIAFDRYWAVTSIDYIRRRTAKRILTMIAMVWAVSLVISIPPLFGWKDPKHHPYISGQCLISQDHGYTIYSTVLAFYLPMFIMIIIYIRIYQVARSRIRKDNFPGRKKKKSLRKAQSRSNTGTTATTMVEYSVVKTCNGCSTDGKSTFEKDNCEKTDNYEGDRDSREEMSGQGSVGKDKNSDENPSVADPVTNGGNMDTPSPRRGMLEPNAADKARALKKHREKLELKRERKAARTLAIVTGSFLVCWVPFFIVALIGPFIEPGVMIPPLVRSLINWLGYCNSLLNPVIYTIFSPEFRNAFRKILFGKYKRRKR